MNEVEDPLQRVEPTKNPTRRRPNYLLVFFALAGITAIEVTVLYIPGIPRAPVLLTMSFIKVMLVVLYFMHLRSDSRWFTFIFFAPFLLVIPMLIVLRL
jgi:cytochrome c oxidase subunit 4